jgi:RNA polymerase sigma factor (sigma-70 family)
MLPSPASYDVRDEHAEDTLRQAELRTDIARAVKSLPPRMREILLLRLDGRSYAEIAGCLDISQGTVAKQLARARDQLRLLLAGWEAE